METYLEPQAEKFLVDVLRLEALCVEGREGGREGGREEGRYE